MVKVATSDSERGKGRTSKFHLKASSQRLNSNIGKIFPLWNDHRIKLSLSEQDSQKDGGGGRFGTVVILYNKV